MPLLKVDTNYIKSFIHKGFVTVPGNAGSYRLYAAKHSEDHLLYSEHLVNENVHRAYNEKEDRKPRGCELGSFKSLIKAF